jgi:hypothetical protein
MNESKTVTTSAAMADVATDVPGDEGSGAYAWESELQRTWDDVEETADGELRSAAPGTWRGGGRAPVHVGVRRGVMRAVFLIIDCSRHAAEHDAEMKPSRWPTRRRHRSPLRTPAASPLTHSPHPMKKRCWEIHPKRTCLPPPALHGSRGRATAPAFYF